MHCVRKINDDLIWVGADNRRALLFEAVYGVPRGVSYNSYLILDEQTALIDTVDRAVTDIFFENIEYALGDRRLDYLVIQHMEPDHSATLLDVLSRYPECRVVCNERVYDMIVAFKKISVDALIVSDKDTLELGRHSLTFIAAPMVHWPEVMVTYDMTDGTLFSADAFGCFGSLNGRIFADEADFERDYLDEARRYYCNVVGKYGAYVKKLLDKLSRLDIKKICPLHGFVWRRDIEKYVNKYLLWSSYTPENQGVMIAYASVYGNTENVVNVLASILCERGVEVDMYDVSVTEPSYILAAAFKYARLVFASPTYNGGVFVKMDDLLRDIAAHGLEGRQISIIENGSWAPGAARRMRETLSSLRNISFTDEQITVRSSADDSLYTDLYELAMEITQEKESK